MTVLINFWISGVIQMHGATLPRSELLVRFQTAIHEGARCCETSVVAEMPAACEKRNFIFVLLNTQQQPRPVIVAYTVYKKGIKTK